MKKTALIVVFSVILALASGPAGWSQDKAKADEDALAKALYEAAKQSIYNKSYDKAVEQFLSLQNKYGKSLYGQDGLYWLGYSLDKHAASLADVKQQLEMKQVAFEHLDSLLKKYPANAWIKDAKILQVQIAEELARSGLGRYRKYIDESIHGGIERGHLPVPPELPVPPPVISNPRKTMDSETELKLVALNALMNMDEEKAFPILEKLMRDEKRPELREHALFVLSQSGSPKVLPILVAVAEKDPSPEMRQRAAFWLGQRHDEEAFAALLRIYDTADVKLKDTLIMSFAQSGNPKGLAKVTEIAKNEKDPEIRSKALFWLGQTQGEKAIPTLLDVYKTTDNAKTKEQIVFALAQADGPKGISALIEIARKETNLEVKKQIVFWLGQSDSPEAIKYIQELIEK